MQAIDQALTSIRTAKETPILGSYVLQDFFTPDLVEQLKYLFRQSRTQLHRWKLVDGQEHMPRVSFYDPGDAFSMWLNDLFGCQELIKLLESQIGHPIVHNGADLWVDSPGYTIQPHFDGGEYHHSIQIYILMSDSDLELGTTIFDNNRKPMFTIPYQNNCGYFFTNTHITLHGMMQPVPLGHIRCSVFSRYKPKIIS